MSQSSDDVPLAQRGTGAAASNGAASKAPLTSFVKDEGPVQETAPKVLESGSSQPESKAPETSTAPGSKAADPAPKAKEPAKQAPASKSKAAAEKGTSAANGSEATEKKKKEKIEYDLPGQTKPTPDESEPLCKFYKSLLAQRPKSELANKWCITHGLCSAEHAEKWLLANGKKVPSTPQKARQPSQKSAAKKDAAPKKDNAKKQRAAPKKSEKPAQKKGKSKVFEESDEDEDSRGKTKSAAGKKRKAGSDDDESDSEEEALPISSRAKAKPAPQPVKEEDDSEDDVPLLKRAKQVAA